MIGYKVLTRSLCSPIQGGAPLFDGRTPWTTPRVACDTGPGPCAPGWHFCRDPQTALRIGGCWPDGWTSALWVVEAEDVVERQDKCRAPQLTFARPTTDAENRAAVLAFCAPFGAHQAAMAAAMDAWGRALARQAPASAEVVEADLRAALDARQLSWRLRRFEARPTRAWWAPWDAGAAREALTVRYARLMGWRGGDPAQYDVGIQDAYRHGLAAALPTGPNELGYALSAPSWEGPDGHP